MPDMAVPLVVGRFLLYQLVTVQVSRDGYFQNSPPDLPPPPASLLTRDNPGGIRGSIGGEESGLGDWVKLLGPYYRFLH